MYQVIYACKHILNIAFGCWLVGNVIDTKGKQIIYCSAAAADAAQEKYPALWRNKLTSYS